MDMNDRVGRNDKISKNNMDEFILSSKFDDKNNKREYLIDKK